MNYFDLLSDSNKKSTTTNEYPQLSAATPYNRQTDTTKDPFDERAKQATEYLSNISKEMTSTVESNKAPAVYNEVNVIPDNNANNTNNLQSIQNDMIPSNSTQNSSAPTIQEESTTSVSDPTSTNLTEPYTNSSSQYVPFFTPETRAYLLPCFPNCSSGEPSFIVPTAQPLPSNIDETIEPQDTSSSLYQSNSTNEAVKTYHLIRKILCYYSLPLNIHILQHH